MADTDLLTRLDAVEADIAIRNLVARYAFVMDDRDCDAIPDLFTRDARVWTADGHMDARGRDAIVRQYEGRFAALGATNHMMTNICIEVEGPDEASGRLCCTAEVWRNRKQQLASLRYTDRYAREDGRWRIADRLMLYFYYLPIERYPGILGTTARNLTYAEPIEADVPERTAAFRRYLETH